MIELYNKGLPVDLVTLQNKLKGKRCSAGDCESGVCAGSGDGSTDFGECEVLMRRSYKDNSMRRKLIKLNEDDRE